MHIRDELIIMAVTINGLMGLVHTIITTESEITTHILNTIYTDQTSEAIHTNMELTEYVQATLMLILLLQTGAEAIDFN